MCELPVSQREFFVSTAVRKQLNPDVHQSVAIIAEAARRILISMVGDRTSSTPIRCYGASLLTINVDE